MRSIVSAFSGLLALGLIAAPSVAQEFGLRNLSFEQVQAVDAFTPRPNGLNITPKLDRSDATYAEGEAVHLSLTPNKTAYVAVLSVGPNGDVTLLFPNTAQPNNRIDANKTVEVPPPSVPGTSIKISPPFGLELLTIIASDKPLDVFEGKDLSQAGTFAAVKGGMNTFLASAKELAKPQRGDQALTIVLMKLQTVAKRPTTPLQPGEVLVDGKPQSPAASTSTGTTTPPAIPVGTGTTPPTAANPIPLVMPAIANPYDVVLKLDKATYQPGEKPAITAQVGRVCYLSVFSVGSDAKAKMIYPNRYQAKAIVNAGTPVLIVGGTAAAQWEATGPARFVAVCSTDDTPIAKVERKEPEVFGDAGTADSLTKDLAEAAKRPAGSTAMVLVTTPSGS